VDRIGVYSGSGNGSAREIGGKGVGRSHRNLLVLNVVWSRAKISQISWTFEQVFMHLVWSIDRGQHVSYCGRAGKPM